MSKRTINPEIARMTFGKETLCGTSKMVFCEHDGKTLYGGVAIPNLTKTKHWNMAVGSLIFVPLKTFVWAEGDGLCGWSIEDLIEHGLAQENWKEK